MGVVAGEMAFAATERVVFGRPAADAIAEEAVRRKQRGEQPSRDDFDDIMQQLGWDGWHIPVFCAPSQEDQCSAQFVESWGHPIFDRRSASLSS
jgi:hypothetical protein